MAKAVIAKYKPQKIKQYQGNVLIEALPAVKSRDEWLEAMAHYPDMDENEISLSQEDRLSGISVVRDIFQPFETHYDFALRIDNLIRSGYVSRKPSVTSLPNTINPRKIKNIAFIGTSGIGKTTSTLQILSQYDQLIVHERPYNIYQIVWLKIECPPDGSLKQLCYSFFEAVDNLEDLNSEYHKMFARYTLDQLVLKMAEVIKLYHVGLLVIDEIQNLSIAKSVTEDTMLNFFVTLNNVANVPVMLIGTHKAKTIFDGDFRHLRRWSNEIKWGRLDNDKYWRVFIEVLWEYNWLKNQPELSDELVDLLYEESQGIVDIVVSIYEKIQEYGLKSETETFDAEIIKEIARNENTDISEVIAAIRNRNKLDLSKYKDVAIETMKELKNSKFKDMKTTEKPIKIELVSGSVLEQLVRLGVSENYVKVQLEKIRLSKSTLSDLEIMTKILKSYEKLTNITKKQKKEADAPLLEYYEESLERGIAVYKLLDDAGISANPEEDFELGIEE
jgi:hypothetical protein